MKRKKLRIMLIIVAVIIVILLLVFWGRITGRTVNLVTTCVDTDKGQDIYTKGKVTYSYENLYGSGEKIYEDYCYLGHRWLKEYYCSNDRAVMYRNKCKKGCVDGACIPN